MENSCMIIIYYPKFVFIARIDLSGGWSDTPPITYEQGGTVLNVAVKLNGQVR